MTLRAPVAISGIGRTAYTRKSGRTTLAQAVEACRGALDDAGFSPDDVGGMITFQVQDSVRPMTVAHALGIDDLSWSADLNGGGNLVATCVSSAAAAVRDGLCEAALVYRSLNGRSGKRLGMAAEGIEVDGDFQFDAPHGYIVPPMWFAMWARRHQAVYGSTSEDLGAIAINQRAHALRNPHAIAREPLTLDDYLAGRWVFEPFRVYDCTYEVDGAVAILVTSEQMARSARTDPVWLAGAADGHSGVGWNNWEDLTRMYGSVAGPRLWKRTGLSPADMDFACLYDCFTYTVMASTADFGFCEKGEEGDFFREGRGTYGGDVVINPHGGLLSEGYIHGLNHHYEAVQQLRHAAGERQVSDAELGLVSSGGGPAGGAVIYSREEPR